MPLVRVFVLSRTGCEKAVEQCRAAGVRLTARPERAQIRRIADAHLADLADDDLAVLGVDRWLDGLGAGLAAHHAGLVPPVKEAVEEAFAARLVKVVFATQTLSVGLHMAARAAELRPLRRGAGLGGVGGAEGAAGGPAARPAAAGRGGGGG